MALAGVELETLIFFILFFYYRSICIIGNGASKHSFPSQTRPPPYVAMIVFFNYIYYEVTIY